MKYGPKIYGILFCGFTCAGFTQFFVIDELKDSLKWEGIFNLYAVLAVLGFIVSIFLKDKVVWKENLPLIDQ